MIGMDSSGYEQQQNWLVYQLQPLFHFNL